MKALKLFLTAALAVYMLDGGTFAAEKPVRGKAPTAREVPQPRLVLQLGHYVLAGALDPSGRQVVTAGDRTHVWDMATGRQVMTLRQERDNSDDLALACGPRGRYLVVNEFLFDRRSGSVIRTFPLGDEYDLVYAVAFGPDGDRVLYGVNHKGMRRIDGHSKWGRKQGLLRLFDVETGRLVRTFALPVGDIVHDASYGPGGRHVAAVDDVGGVRVWDVASGVVTASFNIRVVRPEKRSEIFGFARNGKILFHPRAKRLFVAYGRSVVDWDLVRKAPTREYPLAHGWVGDLAVSPDGRSLLVSDDRGAVLHDTTTGRVLHTFKASKADVGFSADGEFLLVLSRPEEKPIVAELWHASRRLRVASVPVQPYVGGEIPSLLSMKFTTGGEKLRLLMRGQSAPGEDEQIAVATFDFLHARIERVQRLQPPGDHGVAFAWTGDGNRLLLASSEEPKEAALWDLDEGVVVERFGGQPMPIRAVALSRDGKRAITASALRLDDGAFYTTGCHLILWDVESARPLRKIDETNTIDAVAFSSDETRIFAAQWGSNESLVVFDARTGDRHVAPFEMQRDKKPVVRPGHDQVAAVPGYEGLAVWDPTAKRQVARKLLDNWVFALAYSPDGATLATAELAKRICLRDPETLETRWSVPLRHTPNGLAWRPDGKRLLWFPLYGGFVSFLDPVTEASAGQLILARLGEEWLAVAPTGHFTGSPDLLRRVGWAIGGQTFPLDLYEVVFHRPEVVAHLLRGLDPGTVPQLKLAAPPPRVDTTIEKMEHRAVHCRIEATAAAGTEIARVRVFVDGRDLEVQQGKPLELEPGPGGSVLVRCTVEFPPGTTKAVVAALAEDRRGMRSLPSAVTIVRPGSAESVKRTLHVLAVGVSRYKREESNLRFAHEDAIALAELWEKQKGLAFHEVETHVLTDEAATVPAIRAALQSLQARCTPRDVAVVFFSGHGGRGPGGRLYYVPHEADGSPSRYLPWDDLAKALQSVRAAQVLFLSDCCHSGSFGGQRASQDELAAPLLQDSRVMVFSSSRGMELSLEMTKLGHGAFTYALLNGLRGAADLIPDRRITVLELQAYVADRVKQITEDAQHPHIPLMKDFDPELVVAHVK